MSDSFLCKIVDCGLCHWLYRIKYLWVAATLPWNEGEAFSGLDLEFQISFFNPPLGYFLCCYSEVIAI